MAFWLVNCGTIAIAYAGVLAFGNTARLIIAHRFIMVRRLGGLAYSACVSIDNRHTQVMPHCR